MTMRRNGPLTRTPTGLSLRGKYAPLIRKDGINQFVCIITYMDIGKGKHRSFLGLVTMVRIVIGGIPQHGHFLQHARCRHETDA